MIIALWIIFSIIIGALGSKRKCGFFYALMASLLFSPIVGAIYVSLSEKKSDLEFKKEILDSNKISKLKDAHDLLKDGAITEDEYEKIKKEILPDEDMPVIKPFKI